MTEDIDVEQAAKQVLRALRGHRSQVAFSRRLGYASNVAADWEGGRRFPNGSRTLEAARRVGVDVAAGMQAFHPAASAAWEARGLAAWLCALNGNTSRRDLASRAGCSAPQVGRWLRGDADPRLPELLALVEAMTGRVGDWVAALVDVGLVPELSAKVRNRQEVLELVYREPWAAAVLAALSVLPQGTKGPEERVSALLGLPEQDVVRLVAMMERGGAVEREPDGLRVLGLTVDVPADATGVRRHWADVARERLGAPSDHDLYSFNVCAVSREDLDRLRELQSAYFREVRSVVAASEPAKIVALITMHTLVLSAGM